MFQTEIWADLICFDIKPGMYTISSYGRIVNKDGIELKQRIHCKNVYTQYLVVRLAVIGGGSKPFLVHRLIAATFIAMKREEESQVNHKDVDSFNNNALNLEWCTPLYNTRYAFEYGNGRVGEDTYNATFTNDQVHIICRLLKENVPYIEILSTIGIENTDNNRDSIGCIRRGITYTFISKDYELDKIEKRLSPRYTNEQIHDICRRIQNGQTYKDIAPIFGEDISTERLCKPFREFIRRIRKREMFREISQYYSW